MDFAWRPATHFPFHQELCHCEPVRTLVWQSPPSLEVLMNVELRERTQSHVRIYFEKTQDPEIKKYLPQTVTSIQQALANFENTQKPNATSFGRTIYADGNYVGDVWCYGIDLSGTPQAMISYCIFNKCYWGKGVMSRALALFMEEVSSCYGISCFGAFSYAENTASVRVLEKNRFCILEAFSEDGMDSVYPQNEATAMM